jgi:hypothetical protein
MSSVTRETTLDLRHFPIDGALATRVARADKRVSLNRNAPEKLRGVREDLLASE